MKLDNSFGGPGSYRRLTEVAVGFPFGPKLPPATFPPAFVKTYASIETTFYASYDMDKTFFIARFQRFSEVCWFEALFSPQEIEIQNGIISESIYADAGAVIMPPGFYAIGSAYGKTDQMRLMVNLEAASADYGRIYVWFLAHDPLGSGDNTRGLAYVAPDLATFFANLQTEDVL